MRTISETLNTAQQASSIDALVKIVLTHGASSYTYDRGRILDINHEEELYSHKATVLLDNSDGALTNLDLQGFKCVISYGAKTSAGDEYSPCAPLWVVAQRLESSEGRLACYLELIGISNLLAEDRASESYIPEATDTYTVKTLIRIMFDGELTSFNHCPTYTIVWDSEDSLIDSYQPKDTFRIYQNGSRLAALRRLLDYTKCVTRFEDDGQLHVFQPTSDEPYDYEYTLSGGHTFFAKAHRKRLVIPNRVIVQSQPDDGDSFSGEAEDTASYEAIGFYITQWEQARVASNEQAQDIATAILSKYQLHAQAGAATVPMNVGAEVFDYVKVTDARQNDNRVGNIGNITRHYNAKRTEWQMTFSFGGWLSIRDLVSNLETNPSGFGSAGQYFSRLSVKDLYVENILAENVNFVWIDPDNTIDLSKIGDTLDSLPDGEVYAKVKTLHLDAGLIKLDENILYKAGYDPTKESDPSATFKRVKSAALTAGGLVILDEVVVGTYGLVKSTDISAGHILLSKTEKDGDWYDESGVLIDADSGILIYGTNKAFRTRASKNGVDQCYVGSDGKIYAGAGNVFLDSNGLHIWSTGGLEFSYEGANPGYIYGSSGGDIVINPNSLLWLNKGASCAEIYPHSHEAYACGYSNKAWSQVVGEYVYSSDGAIHSYQKQDDIALLKAIKSKQKKGKDILDVKTLPKELVIENDYVNVAGLTGFNIGVMKVLLARIEALESKVGGQ